MKLIEKVRINFKQVDRCRIGKAYHFHEGQQHEQIVELHELRPELLLVSGERQSVKEFTDVLPQLAPPHIGIVVHEGRKFSWLPANL